MPNYFLTELYLAISIFFLYDNVIAVRCSYKIATNFSSTGLHFSSFPKIY